MATGCAWIAWPTRAASPCTWRTACRRRRRHSRCSARAKLSVGGSLEALKDNLICFPFRRFITADCGLQVRCSTMRATTCGWSTSEAATTRSSTPSTPRATSSSGGSGDEITSGGTGPARPGSGSRPGCSTPGCSPRRAAPAGLTRGLGLRMPVAESDWRGVIGTCSPAAYTSTASSTTPRPSTRCCGAPASPPCSTSATPWAAPRS